MKKTLVLLVIYLVHSSSLAHTFTVDEIRAFHLKILEAQVDSAALDLVEKTLKEHPNIIHEKNDFLIPELNGLPLIHIALFKNKADELGIRLLNVLRKAGMDFKATSGPSQNQLLHELNPIAFLLYHAEKANSPRLISLLIENALCKAHHSSVITRMNFIRESTGFAFSDKHHILTVMNTYPKIIAYRAVQRFLPPQQSMWHGSQSSLGIPCPSIGAIPASSVCNQNFYDLGLSRQLIKWNIIAEEFELVFAVFRGDSVKSLETIKLSRTASKFLYLIFAGLSSPEDIFRHLQKLMDLNNQNVIKNCVLATLCYLSPGHSSRLSSQKIQLFDDSTLDKMKDKLMLPEAHPAVSKIMNTKANSFEDKQSGSQLKSTATSINPVININQKFKKGVSHVLYKIEEVEIYEDKILLKCTFYKRYPQAVIVDVHEHSETKETRSEEHWGIEKEHFTYTVKSELSRVMLLEILLGDKDPVELFTYFRTLRTKAQKDERNLFSLLQEIHEALAYRFVENFFNMFTQESTQILKDEHLYLSTSGDE